MAWKPDQKFETAVSRLIARARETAHEWAQQQLQVILADFGGRGLLQSGGVLAAKEQLSADELQRVGDALISDVLKLFTDVYGTIPVEAMPWIRETMGGFVQRLADTFADERADDR